MKTGLRFAFDRGMLTISFYRPEAGNSFGIDEAKALTSIISEHKKSARGLLFVSDHSFLFCAGGDLKAHAKLKTKKEGIEQARVIRKAQTLLSEWPIPKAAFVNGDCFGGGMELLSCFDHRVAAPHVMFGFWQRRISLSFGWGGFERWSKKISPDVIRDLGSSARLIGAHEAMRLGLIHEIGNRSAAERWLRESVQWTPESARALSQLDVKNETKLFESLWWNPTHQKILR
jgi:enoyl-CoA hydratase/carnithine racemase